MQKAMTKYEKRKHKLLMFVMSNPEMSNEAIAKKFKISTRTVTRYRRLLKDNEYIISYEDLVHKNKHNQ
ncbi:winged helix-turn-helix domain-containing protein [Mycoplasmopsis edwardii]|uniref:Uncharacterized protein conserved in archaea n=2 Tax=Mycoplasmopsis edwardii TaxID=53558 RepID=A0A3B0PPK9_9BACT|nr:winged helix-turn-helix domain-containing protein [Mycoplasmopsis edwardii]WBP84072.1 winged helix-turn-helix domain-containing protein [Mycoplasmopsis edwardii]SYV96695.1 Uncharacterized protein conserved in archaea [Mycoplasmopsis edwardii]